MVRDLHSLKILLGIKELSHMQIVFPALLTEDAEDDSTTLSSPPPTTTRDDAICVSSEPVLAEPYVEPVDTPGVASSIDAPPIITAPAPTEPIVVEPE